MKMVPMKYEMVIRWSEEDNCYLVGFPDFPGQQWRTHGATYAEATAQGVEALESLILVPIVKSWLLPAPIAPSISGA
jgi:antitoxin HicB